MLKRGFLTYNSFITNKRKISAKQTFQPLLRFQSLYGVRYIVLMMYINHCIHHFKSLYHLCNSSKLILIRINSVSSGLLVTKIITARQFVMEKLCKFYFIRTLLLNPIRFTYIWFFLILYTFLWLLVLLNNVFYFINVSVDSQNFLIYLLSYLILYVFVIIL